MSLTSAMYAGVSGLLNNGDAMNVIGNNISNVNTVGFKDGRTLFSDMLSASAGGSSQVGKGVQMQAIQNVFSQGPTLSSENITDMAIQGNSFFALGPPTVGNAAGATIAKPVDAFLSRAGAFKLDSGFNLVNPDGYQVLDTAGKPIQFTAAMNLNKITNIDSQGKITYLDTANKTQTYTTNIGVVTVADPGALAKMGGSLYKDTAATAGVAGSYATADGSSEQILSNSLEQSNVDIASEFVKMITTQRAYSANSKTITTTDQMTQEVLGLIR